MITNMDKYKSSGNLILIPKLEDYIRYTFQILIKIPRIEKFNIGSEIKTSCLKMLEYAHFCLAWRHWCGAIFTFQSYEKLIFVGTK